MELSGREGKIYSEQELNDAVQNHANKHSAEPHYRQSVTFGKKFLKHLLKGENVKAIKFHFADKSDDGRETIIPVPVDKYGNILPIEPIESGVQSKPQADPPHCPPQC